MTWVKWILGLNEVKKVSKEVKNQIILEGSRDFISRSRDYFESRGISLYEWEKALCAEFRTLVHHS